MARVCRNDGIGHSQKTLGKGSGHFETIEALATYVA